MPEWQSRGHLEDHFTDHGPEVGARTVEEYDASARIVVERADIIFAYEDPTTHLPRVGCYDSETGLFTALSDDDRWIVSHFRPHPDYIRNLIEED